MIVNRPFSFLLVANAASCTPDFPGYSQIWDEVSAGNLKFDPSQTHEGVWLLDAAIEARTKSTGGLRAFARNHGADPSMDKLWASWVEGSPPSIFGDNETQCQRLARLVKSGSSHCLSALLAKSPQTLEGIQKEWDKKNVAWMGKPFLDYVLSEDLRGTLGVLLAAGLRPSSSISKDHPFTKVKSPESASLLLRHGVSVDCFPGQELIELTSARDLPAKVISALVGVITSQSTIVDTPSARLNRMSQRLSDKTSEQFQLEARSAGWSPASRPDDFSPVHSWAQKFLGDSSSNFIEGGALSWLRKQALHGKVLAGRSHSDAFWAWACLFPHNPAHAQYHAEVAQDMDQEIPSWARLNAFYDKLQQASALEDGCFEKAVVRLIMEQHWKSGSRAPKEMWERWFIPSGDRTWVLDAIRHKPRCTLQLNAVLESGVKSEMPGHSMALALMLAGIVGQNDIIKEARSLWEEGVRPAIRVGDADRLVKMVECSDQEFASTIQAWCLNKFSIPSTRQSSHLRL